jgi:hypothetical protein
MAVVAVILGGIAGFAAALVSLFAGATIPLALLIWCLGGAGLAAALVAASHSATRQGADRTRDRLTTGHA